MSCRNFNVGTIVKHFKRETIQYPGCKYLYKIIAFAEQTETKEKLVIYEALYDDEDTGVVLGNVFARPYDMFMSKVDKNKYPNIKQKYRFEQFYLEELNESI